MQRLGLGCTFISYHEANDMNSKRLPHQPYVLSGTLVSQLERLLVECAEPPTLREKYSDNTTGKFFQGREPTVTYPLRSSVLQPSKKVSVTCNILEDHGLNISLSAQSFKSNVHIRSASSVQIGSDSALEKINVGVVVGEAPNPFPTRVIRVSTSFPCYH